MFRNLKSFFQNTQEKESPSSPQDASKYSSQTAIGASVKDDSSRQTQHTSDFNSEAPSEKPTEAPILEGAFEDEGGPDILNPLTQYIRYYCEEIAQHFPNEEWGLLTLSNQQFLNLRTPIYQLLLNSSLLIPIVKGSQKPKFMGLYHRKYQDSPTTILAYSSEEECLGFEPDIQDENAYEFFEIPFLKLSQLCIVQGADALRINPHGECHFNLDKYELKFLTEGTLPPLMANSEAPQSFSVSEGGDIILYNPMDFDPSPYPGLFVGLLADRLKQHLEKGLHSGKSPSEKMLDSYPLRLSLFENILKTDVFVEIDPMFQQTGYRRFITGGEHRKCISVFTHLEALPSEIQAQGEKAISERFLSLPFAFFCQKISTLGIQTIHLNPVPQETTPILVSESEIMYLSKGVVPEPQAISFDPNPL
ncbi:MAG: hypothetical protein K2X66_13940 [Cyanobacteria bacterium]|nr:hypothetical protein [Cyanobacteriota bacterium]